MRKLTMLVALGTILSLALAAPALADLLTTLGPGPQTYNELRCPTAANAFDGDEEVFGKGGADTLNLNLCGDTNTTEFPEDGLANTPECDPLLNCTTDSDADKANGNSGRDTIKVNDGDIQDTANGGNDRDTCTGDRDLGSDNAVGDPAPAGGPDEDIKDNLADCETKIWVNGNFYNQT
jgi:hypothetical protein